MIAQTTTVIKDSSSKKPNRTLVIIKPDAVFMGYTPDIIKTYKEAGLTVIKRSDITITRQQAEILYKKHKGKPFYAGLVLFTSSGSSVVLILEGEDVIGKVRKMNGGKKAKKGTIRHDFPSAGGPCVVVHAADSQKSVLREMKLFFPNFNHKT